ncbi:helix-turn-helix domain-containing protein [uncultured Dokdonia sp.]|uniref:helix-turn-helix domain-containing protein n=1 Tax=uncultured Dokdonia sp. TaxID=575653 RepID=UPI0026257DD4|nr:helix-turn-helix domain-containing protein [uncultured Dokdonia sp.]
MNQLPPKKHFYSVLFILLLYSFVGKAQDATFIIPDSLKSVSYDALLDKYAKVYLDTIKSKIYLNTYYKRAILDDDDIKKAIALSNISYYLEGHKTKVEVVNLAIHYTEKSNNRDYLMILYTLVGEYYLIESLYDKALDFYLKSLAIAEEFQNEDYIYISKHNIALIKGDIGNNRQSLKLFKECYDREVKVGSKSYLYDYISSCLYLSESLIRNKKMDSANFYLQKISNKNHENYPDLFEKITIYKNISDYNRNSIKNYKKLIYSLNKINNQSNNFSRELIIGNYHAGLISKRLKIDSSYTHFEKVITLYLNNKTYIPEVRYSLENLIKHYKVKKAPKEQLKHVENLLKFDSIYSIQKNTLGGAIYTKYDTPVLLSQKEQLIKNLDEKNITLSYSAGVLLAFVILLSFFGIYVFRRNRKLKILFDNIVTSTDNRKTTETINKVIPETIKRKELTISKKIIEGVLLNLKKFEKDKGYLNKNLTAASVAKKTETNSKYLSQIVNHYKEKTLTNYINDLRINEAINLLQSNNKILNYTIQSIAEEVGFNNAESFSKAFFKHTGMKPSYFIKNLKDRILN